jgi:S-formylglutathione hydrolase FrmB
MDPNNAPSTDPRVDHLLIDGVHVNVLVPPLYAQRHRRYPVLYLFHGAFGDEDSFTTQTDLLAFTAGMDDRDEALIVMPDGGHIPAGRDWVDGTHHQETFVLDTLLPYIDAHYRTMGDRSHRAAAGFSAGGMDAMIFAARHPDLFVAAGSFSGPLDIFAPVGIGIIQQFADLDDQLCGASANWLGIWGDPVAHPMGWMGHDPSDLAANLGDVSVYVASGNGVPCADDPTPDPFLSFVESVAFDMATTFDAALTAAGVRHVTELRDCGVHRFSNASQDLRRFWPHMLDAFGQRPPSRFDYRTGDDVASVWGWAFGADSARAPEFLDVRDASAWGLALTGSGSESVVTAPLFGPYQRIEVIGAGQPRSVRADGAGRLAFTVDLGPPHIVEEGTASASSSFVNREVRFERGHYFR